jgi:Flp pilus assembly protein TadG
MKRLFNFWNAGRPARNDMESGSSRAPRPLSRRRRGAAAIEFSLVAIPFLFLIFTMVEFGRYVMIYQILVDASREGARRAVVESATPAGVEARVQNLLNESTLSVATVDVSPDDFSDLWLGEPVTVTVTVSYGDVSWISPIWFAGSPTLSATSTMHVERPE